MKFSFALLFSLFTIFSYAQHDITVYYEYTRDGYALYADSQETFPVIIEFEFNLLNLKVIRKGPSAIVVPPKGKKIKLVDLVAIKVFKGYSFKYTYTTREDTRTVVTLDPVSSPDITVKTDSVIKSDQSVVADVEVPAARTKKEIRSSRVAKRKAIAKLDSTAISKSKTKRDKAVVMPEPNLPEKPVTSALPDVTPTPVIVGKTEIKSPNEVVSIPLAVSKPELQVEPVISVIPEVKTIPEAEEQPVTLVIPEVEAIPEVTPQPVTSVIPEVKTVPVETTEPVTITETTKKPVTQVRPESTVKYPASGKHDSAFKYYLPFKKGGNYLVSQGYQESVSHQNKFALDFAMSVGTEIYAARGGIVSEIVQNNSQGCDSRDCAKYENYILINHSDGSFARYAHIKENGAVVKPGELIGIGQHIGYSGDVGWTANGSLHFEVFVLKASEEKSIKTNFLLGDGSDYGILFPQQSYSRKY